MITNNRILNNRGIYYAREIVDNINKLKDILIDNKVITISDLGTNIGNRADISKTISTEFSGDNTSVAFLMKGYSEEIYENFCYMGNINLEGSDLNDAYTYFKELKSVYTNTNIHSKSYNYFKKYIVRALDARDALINALRRAERSNGSELVNKQYGTSYRFETDPNNFITNFSTEFSDFTKIGLRVPNEENEYVQIETNELFREKIGSNATSINAILNVIYSDDKERDSKIYPVISTFENKPIKVVRMIKANDLIEMLVNDYGAQVSNEIYDLDGLYGKCKVVADTNLQPVRYFGTGKNKLFTINMCEHTNEWSSAILKNENHDNVALYTKRALTLYLARKNQRRAENY